MSNDDVRGCLYHLRDDGIHEFIFTGKGEKGLDEFFEYAEHVFASYADEPLLRYYIDATRTDGNTSMVQMMRRFRDLEARYPGRPDGRTALIHKPNALVTLGATFIDTFAPRRDRTRLFREGKEAVAIEWLLSQEA
jgi:hypothetical protein